MVPVVHGIHLIGSKRIADVIDSTRSIPWNLEALFMGPIQWDQFDCTENMFPGINSAELIRRDLQVVSTGSNRERLCLFNENVFIGIQKQLEI